MYNWSTNTESLKLNPTAYTRWRLEQLINYGLNGERIDRQELRQHLQTLDIDPARKHFLEFLLS